MPGRNRDRKRSVAEGVRRGVRLDLEVLEERAVPSAASFEPMPQFSFTQAPMGYWPDQVRQAYGFDQIPFLQNAGDPNFYNENAGAGTTIAIVDAYADPNIAGDLSTFSTAFGLPQMNAGGPTFSAIDQSGGQTDPTGKWEMETALDVEWAHAIAPAANIVLVEAAPGSPGLMTGVDTARHLPGVVVVSMSWGGPEFAGESDFSDQFTTPPGHTPITFVAAAGDGGAPAQWPAVSPNVLAVGGTRLVLDPNNQPVREAAWVNGGGGYSQFIDEPAYQSAYAQANPLGNDALLGTNRGSPDVSYNAGGPGYAVYDSFVAPNRSWWAPPGWSAASGWVRLGGTSAGAPQWAALVAIVDGARGPGNSLDGSTQTLPALYRLAQDPVLYPQSFNDVTGGISLGLLGYSVGPGYDPVTGLGTPQAGNLAVELVGLVGWGANLTFQVAPGGPSDLFPRVVITPDVVQAQEDTSAARGAARLPALVPATAAPTPALTAGDPAVRAALPAVQPLPAAVLFSGADPVVRDPPPVLNAAAPPGDTPPPTGGMARGQGPENGAAEDGRARDVSRRGLRLAWASRPWVPDRDVIRLWQRACDTCFVNRRWLTAGMDGAMLTDRRTNRALASALVAAGLALVAGSFRSVHLEPPERERRGPECWA